MIEIGKVVGGKYKILREVGRGNMGIVYMAVNESANKTWAIKEVQKDGTQAIEVVKKGLIAERDLLKELKHPSIPSIIDVIDEGETFLIVMDYIEGRNLNEFLNELGPQSQETIVEWTKQLCMILDYLHTRETPIIYGDMKPENIMLKPDGNVVLIDYGAASKLGMDNQKGRIKFASRSYMAPEREKGVNNVETDIYSLGATMYKLLTRRSPKNMIPIRKHNQGFSEGLEKIILKCTKINPKERYQSCAELKIALEHYVESSGFIKKRYKRNLTIFLANFSLTLIFFTLGFLFQFYFVQANQNYYEEKLANALKESDYNNKISIYEDAIRMKPGEQSAYMGLIGTFKENDSSFTINEEEILIKYLLQNKEKLMEDHIDYASLCFETGKLYWYYYKYGNTEDNQITRMKAAIPWFDDAVTKGDDSFSNKNMAIIYCEVGKFYRDISINTVEANDKGLYKPFWDNMKNLIRLVATNEDENEIVKLELYELVRSAISQYATKFKGDGITKEDMMEVFNQLANNVDKIKVTTDKTIKMQNEIISLLNQTEKAIRIAFSS